MKTKPIMLRLSDEQYTEMDKSAGETPVATYIRNRLFTESTDPLKKLKDEEYKKFFIQVLQETDLLELVERLITKAKAVKQFNSPDPIEYGKAIAKCSAALANIAETTNEKDSPEGWKIQQTPNGDKFPYYSDDLNKLILVLERDGQRPIIIDENHDWWKYFTV